MAVCLAAETADERLCGWDSRTSRRGTVLESGAADAWRAWDERGACAWRDATSLVGQRRTVWSCGVPRRQESSIHAWLRYVYQWSANCVVQSFSASNSWAGFKNSVNIVYVILQTRSFQRVHFPANDVPDVIPKGPFIATQLNSTRRRVELSCVAINGPLEDDAHAL